MTRYDSSEDQRPLTYVNGHPVYATTLMVALHVLTMIGTSLAFAFHQNSLVGALSFSSSEFFFRGWLWQGITYAFVNGPQFWFIVEMILLYRFGREVEQFLGRRSFLRLYGLLLLLTPAALSVAGAFQPISYSGSFALHFAIFVAFAALYPGVSVFFGLTAKWMALILLGIYSLQALASGSVPTLIALWVSCGVAALFVGRERGQFQLPGWQFWRKPKFYVVRHDNKTEDDDLEDDALESIDPLLEKISRSGLNSLTRKERARLEEAREALMKKERR